jgi:hypothetical protein
MNKTLVSAVILSALSLQGCPVYRVDGRSTSTPLPKPLTLSETGDFTHKPSHYTFPPTVASFRRVALTQYDAEGLDISVGYDGGTKDCPVALTIYMKPAPRMSFIGADPAVVQSLESNWLSSAYQRWKAEIAQAHPGAAPKTEDSMITDGYPGRKAVYTIARDESELFVFLVEHQWILTYRDTYQADCAVQATESLKQFGADWHGRTG